MHFPRSLSYRFSPTSGDKAAKTTIPVTSINVGDEVVLRLQGGARHTGLEVHEFILEK